MFVSRKKHDRQIDAAFTRIEQLETMLIKLNFKFVQLHACHELMHTALLESADADDALSASIVEVAQSAMSYVQHNEANMQRVAFLAEYVQAYLEKFAMLLNVTEDDALPEELKARILASRSSHDVESDAHELIVDLEQWLSEQTNDDTKEN